MLAVGRGTHAEALGTIFQGSCFCGVGGTGKVTVRLEKCTMASNTGYNVVATDGATISLAGCTAANSMEGKDLVVGGQGTGTEATGGTIRGNSSWG